ITPGMNLEFIPTVTAERVDRREELTDDDLREGDIETEVGLTARWGITPNLNLNAAINPDFSQVEADAAQLGINERFALFFPEQRPFFLEGADFFDSPLSAVFTRTVADPSWGIKLTGKEGPHGIGTFVAEDEITNLIFPGSQGSSATSLDLATTDTVARYRRDFGRSSAIGGLVTSREGGDYSNRVYGIDGLYRLTDSDRVIFQALGSETRYPVETAEEFDQPRGSFDDTAYSVHYRHASRDWFWRVGYDDIGRDFRADMGFMPRVDYTFLIGGLERIWWGDEGDWFNRISFGGDADLTEDQDGELLEREYELFFNYQGPKESGFWLGPGMRTRTFEGIEFEQEYLNWAWWMQTTPDLYLNFWGFVGDAIDFANTRPGEQLGVGAWIRYNMGTRTKSILSHDFRELDVEGGQLFEANLTRLRVVYQLNLRTFVRAIVEYTDITRDPTLYIDEVDAETENVFSQLLFSYKLSPQTVLFVGYSDNYAADRTVDLTQTNRALFFKVGYDWVL
ncbi:MAG: DUF5916 domain-containing protein, partial [Halobacteriales archaeon]|nr:DUF5916 domain-containing protein [Halobacteriales archaeon]